MFSVRRPQYFIISHTKSQRLLVTRHRLSREKGNLTTRNHELGMPVVVGSRCFSPGTPLSSKTNISQFQFDQESSG